MVLRGIIDRKIRDVSAGNFTQGVYV